MRLRIGPLLLGEKAGLSELIMGDISIGFLHPEAYQVLVFPCEDETGDQRLHHRVFGCETELPMTIV